MGKAGLGPGFKGPFGDMTPAQNEEISRHWAATDNIQRKYAMAARHKSVETKYMEDRDKALRGLRRLDRRTFLEVLGASAGAVMAKGLMPPHTFQLVNMAEASVDKRERAEHAAIHLRLYIRHAHVCAHAQPALR